MNKQEVINYVMKTPQNTNEAVLSTILDDYASESGEGGELDSLFTKTEVTLAVDSESIDAVTFTLSCYLEDNPELYGFIVWNETLFFKFEISDMIPTETITIPIYILKDSVVFVSCSSNNNVYTTISGDIERGTYGLSIYGDCTIIGKVTGK